MQRRRLLACALAAVALAFPAGLARAQLGEQPIRIVFPFAAGGSGDALARVLADAMRAELNRAVIVENRTGAAGRIGVQAVKAAAPDGLTLLLTPIAPVAVYQHVYPALEYDPIADFQPVTQVATFEFGLAVGPQVPAKSLNELVEWLKANPAQRSYATPGAGTLPHFFGVLFARAAGLELQHINYRGSAAALTDLIGGQVPVLVTTATDLIETHKAGRIRVLATSDKARSPFLPDLPTFREAGYDIEGTGWYGVFAPARTPPDIVERYNKVLVAAVRSPQIRDRLIGFGLAPTGTSVADFAAIQRADSARWAPAVKASGFTPQQ
jgi:tripartite-type tricarboxylate transporter receptor subunit TctC